MSKIDVIYECNKTYEVDREFLISKWNNEIFHLTINDIENKRYGAQIAINKKDLMDIQFSIEEYLLKEV
jgi:hypothetical protein